MIKNINKILLIIACFCILNVFSPISTRAYEYKFTPDELIKIVDPYIVEDFRSYTIKNQEELISKIGLENFNSLNERLSIANREKRAALNKDAVHDIHMAILREAGATVNAEWWGKRIKTPNRTVAIKVRKLANTFGTASSVSGFRAGLIAAKISTIPGFGTPAAIAGALVGLISLADSVTWSTVSDKVADKINDGIYNLTIDINAWMMEVKVY